jgi:hypothetical protein
MINQHLNESSYFSTQVEIIRGCLNNQNITCLSNRLVRTSHSSTVCLTSLVITDGKNSQPVSLCGRCM